MYPKELEAESQDFPVPGSIIHNSQKSNPYVRQEMNGQRKCAKHIQ